MVLADLTSSSVSCHASPHILPCCVSVPFTATAPQVWKERVYTHLERHLVERVDSVTTYLLLYHEV